MVYYLAQAVGLTAFVIAILSFQRNSQKGILGLQLLSTSLFCLHFLLLGAQVGALLNAVGALRAFVFGHREKRWAQGRGWLAVFLLLSVGACAVTWEDARSLLPMAGMICTTVAFWIRDPVWVRRISFPSSPCWLIYNAAHRSWAGVLTECFVMGSILVAMWRYEWRPRMCPVARTRKKGRKAYESDGAKGRARRVCAGAGRQRYPRQPALPAGAAAKGGLLRPRRAGAGGRPD